MLLKGNALIFLHKTNLLNKYRGLNSDTCGKFIYLERDDETLMHESNQPTTVQRFAEGREMKVGN